MCSHFFTSAQCRIPYCYTYRQLYAGATQGELPEGQERVPWGIPVSRSSLAWWPRSAPADSIIGTIYPTGVSLDALHHAFPLRNSLFPIFNSQFAESPSQTVPEHLLYRRENHSTETILHADSQTASHKLNTAAAAPDILHSSADTAA